MQSDMAVSRKRFCSQPLDTVLQNLEAVLTIVLSDLVTSRLILVEVVFPVEAALLLYVAIQSQSSAQGGDECLRLKLWLAARKGCIK